jgi:hypothetical protein
MPLQPLSYPPPIRTASGNSEERAAQIDRIKGASTGCGGLRTDHDRTGGRHERRREPERPGGASLEPRADRGIQLASFYGKWSEKGRESGQGPLTVAARAAMR